MNSEQLQSEIIDQEVMDCFGLYFKDLLVRTHDQGLNLNWNNEQILRWYETEGRRLQTKLWFRKLPAVIIYLLCRNDRALLAGNVQMIAST